MDNDIKLIVLNRLYSELRRGVPVFIKEGEKIYCVTSAERIVEKIFDLFYRHKLNELVFTKNRFNFLFNKHYDYDLKIVSEFDFNYLLKIQHISLNSSFKNDGEVMKISELDKKIISLFFNAKLIPCFLKTEISEVPEHFIEIEANLLDDIKQNSDDLFLLAHSTLKIHGNVDCKIFIFTSLSSNEEHVAILTGKLLDETDHSNLSPLLRVHSSCFTGDLLTSMRCDCNLQLNRSLERMSQDPDGGILIYLSQEGRGIGLSNKIRAYNLQDQGLDTVEANLAIGFDDEHRDFSHAHQILSYFKITQLKLLTNNPKKASELSELGYKITEIVPHIIENTGTLTSYYKTKAEKMNHAIPKELYQAQ